MSLTIVHTPTVISGTKRRYGVPTYNGPYTIMLWIRFTSLSLVLPTDFVGLYELTNETTTLPSEGLQIVLVDGERRVQFFTRDSGGTLHTVTSFQPIQLDQWYNIALIRHSTNAASVSISGLVTLVFLQELGQRTSCATLGIVDMANVAATFTIGVMKIWDKAIGKKELISEMNTIRAQDRNELNSLYFFNSLGSIRFPDLGIHNYFLPTFSASGDPRRTPPIIY